MVETSVKLTHSRLSALDVHCYFTFESLTGLLLFFMALFSPWAFGTTEPWSIWTMNVCGYGLGVLLVAKIRIRRTAENGKSEKRKGRKTGQGKDWFATMLGVLTIAILLYCLIAAVNARAVFDPVSQTLVYRDCASWLPHSFDRGATWDAFCGYLALACFFWAVRDWLSAESCRFGALNGRSPNSNSINENARVATSIPVRLQRLLWVLIISGGLLGLEGIVQRLSGSPRLLFLVKPQIHQSALTQFASYAYRANAAQYLNLVWPVALGFWLWIARSTGATSTAALISLLSAVVMAASPIISSARGATLVDGAMLFTAAGALLIGSLCANSRRGWRSRGRPAVWVISFLGATFVLGLDLGWKELSPRLKELSAGFEERQLLYERARPIADDYALFGTGPGTFERVFQLYRSSPDVYWPAQLHNDWLETRLTFGWAGTLLILLALGAVLASGLTGRGQLPLQFRFMLYLALAGCLLQARWDFPLQVYSILFLFLVWCAILSASSPRNPMSFRFKNR